MNHIASDRNTILRGEPEFYRIAEVARILGLGKSLTYDLVARGVIPSVYLAGHRVRRVPRAPLYEWIAKQTDQFGGGNQ